MLFKAYLYTIILWNCWIILANIMYGLGKSRDIKKKMEEHWGILYWKKFPSLFNECNY